MKSPTNLAMWIIVLVFVSVSAFSAGSIRAQDDAEPILTIGEAGAWDSSYVAVGDVMVYEGEYHMFYNGSQNAFIDPISIGHATSPDGIHWTKDAANPILTPVEVDANNSTASLFVSTVRIEGDTWVMYLTVFPMTGLYRNSQILRATSDSPSGPWIADPTLLVETGNRRRWDMDAVTLPLVVKTETEYQLFFTGCCGRGQGYGLATSSDGLTWTKYDDPETDERIYAESDVVLAQGPDESWYHDNLAIFDVWQSDGQWHMLFNGQRNTTSTEMSSGFGYMSSEDGIHWTPSASNPFWIGECTTSLISPLEGVFAVTPSIDEETTFVYGDFALDRSVDTIYLVRWTPPLD